ncbi:MAG: hypothetical protein AB1603_00860 [Chloroflexota bacterium]
MEGTAVVALVLGIPLAAFPAAFVLYLTIGGAYEALRRTHRKPATLAKTKA